MQRTSTSCLDGFCENSGSLTESSARQGGSAVRHRRDGPTPGHDSLSATFVRTAIPDGFRTLRMPSSPSFRRSPPESGPLPCSLTRRICPSPGGLPRQHSSYSVPLAFLPSFPWTDRKSVV